MTTTKIVPLPEAPGYVANGWHIVPSVEPLEPGYTKIRYGAEIPQVLEGAVWKGKPIAELPRETLLEIIAHYVAKEERDRKNQAKRLQFLRRKNN